MIQKSVNFIIFSLFEQIFFCSKHSINQNKNRIIDDASQNNYLFSSPLKLNSLENEPIIYFNAALKVRTIARTID